MQEKNFIADLIPTFEQGWLLNLFNQGYRTKLEQPDLVIEYVKSKVCSYLSDLELSPDRKQTLTTFLEALNTPQALKYAKEVISYEQLPLQERAKLKEQKQAQHKQNWLASQPPTIKQINYLALLGYKGKSPTNKLEASTLIDQLLNEKGKAA